MSEPRSALLVITRRLGDVLLTTPVVRSLKDAWPALQLDALVFRGTEDILQGHPEVRSVLTVSERPSAAEHGRLFRRLFRRYDVALSLLPGDRPTLYARLAGRRALGITEAGRKHWWKRALLSKTCAFDPDRHTVVNNLDLARLCGATPHASVEPRWSAHHETELRALWPERLAGAYVVLHPAPRFAYKAWRADAWICVAGWLLEQKIPVVLTGSTDRVDRETAAMIVSTLNHPGIRNLAGQLSLAATAHLLADARAYVGPDTVVTHMAAALGTPTVALFGPSDPVKWGPWPAGHAPRNPYVRVGSQRNGNVALLQGQAACVPCREEGCERHVGSLSACLQELPCEAVLQALEDLLGATPQTRATL